MGRRHGNQRPVAVREESGYEKEVKRRRRNEEDGKLAGTMKKFLQSAINEDKNSASSSSEELSSVTQATCETVVESRGTVDIPSAQAGEGPSAEVAESPYIVVSERPSSQTGEGPSAPAFESQSGVAGESPSAVAGENPSAQLCQRSSCQAGEPPSALAGESTSPVAGQIPSAQLCQRSSCEAGEPPSALAGESTSLVVGGSPSVVAGKSPLTAAVDAGQRDKFKNEDFDQAASCSTGSIDSSDPCTWPNPLPQHIKRTLVSAGPIQKILSCYPKRGDRSFSAEYFKSTASTNEELRRDWLLYSESSNSLFCFPCCLFARRTAEDIPWIRFGISQVGFTDFSHQSRAIQMHEDSNQHFDSVIMWKNYARLTASKTSLGAEAIAAFEREVSFWRSVLKSMLDAVLFLAKNNLAFRGSSEILGSQNCGNFLSLVELLSHYHGPLAIHIERLKKGGLSYMSPTIQNEFISLVGGTVRKNILQKIKGRKFFSLLLDATPDSSHQEQISEIIRTVNIANTGCSIEESFIDFIHFDKKKGAEISDAILKKIKADGMDISDCRGQGYDNGANMSGVYQGVQSHIKQANEYAEFIPCAAHSLNLVGQNAVAKVLPGKLILGQVQMLFTFFSSSPQRWSSLKAHVWKTLKSPAQTRWSAKHAAVSALYEQFHEVLDTLNEIIDSEHTNAQTLVDATANISQVNNFRFLLGLSIWNKILSRINKTNVILQKQEMDIGKAAKHLQGLVDWLKEFREIGFQACYQDAKEKSSLLEMNEESGFQYRLTRNRPPIRFRSEDGGNDYDPPESNLQRFQKEFFEATMEKLIEEFDRRFVSIHRTSEDFGILWGKTLATASKEEQTKLSMDLALKYDKDLNAAKLAKEMEFLKSAVTPFLLDSQGLERTSALDVLNILTINGLAEQFINCHTALRIFLTMPVTVAQNERSFSKLKLIKNYLRSSMGQERLSDLAIVSIEHKETSNLSFDSLINEFASSKCRQVPL